MRAVLASGESEEEAFESDEVDELEDERILAQTGVISESFQPSQVWKILIGCGVILIVVGVVVWYVFGGLSTPNLSVVPGGFESLMALVVVVLGIVCVIAGIALLGTLRREPRDLKPIA